jgi:hypothetical protein
MIDGRVVIFRRLHPAVPFADHTFALDAKDYLQC